MKEEWRDIPGYEGMYQVSDQGRVKGLDRKDSRGRFRAERIMVPVINNKGYCTIHLHKAGACKTAKIHRLVAQAFIDEYSDKLQVDHINGVRGNNSANNLRMATNSQNSANTYKVHGKTSRYKGVYWHKAINKWCTALAKKHIGAFDSEKEAALAYDKKAVDVFGEYAVTNRALGLFDGTLG